MPIEKTDLKTILDDFEYFIEHRQDANLKVLILSMHPSDLAQILEQLSDDDHRLYVFKLLDAQFASETILELDDVTREHLVKLMESNRLSELVDEMDSDDATDFVSELASEVAERVLENVEEEDVREVRQLLVHEEDTAGGIMALELIYVNQESTVDNAIQEIRKKKDEVDDVYNVYVVDSEMRLVGIVTVKDLILADGEAVVADIMNEDILSVPVTMDQEEVAAFAKRYDLVSVPVVDERSRLLGRITIDDIVDVMVEEATEDIQRMAGISEEEELRQTSVFLIVKGRLPWLVTGLLGGLFSAIVMSGFEESLRTEITIALFVPVILAMGGNVGMQSSALVVRGLATGEIGAKDSIRRLFKELKVSVLNGMMLGLILFGVVFIGFRDSSITIALLIGVALLSVIILAGIVGSTIPVILKKMNIDPALATGPFITTSNDIIGLYVYLVLASFFLGLL